jgi:hypothetical protein
MRGNDTVSFGSPEPEYRVRVYVDAVALGVGRYTQDVLQHRRRGRDFFRQAKNLQDDQPFAVDFGHSLLFFPLHESVR